MVKSEEFFIPLAGGAICNFVERNWKSSKTPWGKIEAKEIRKNLDSMLNGD
jgi:hypothetical protein